MSGSINRRRGGEGGRSSASPSSPSIIAAQFAGSARRRAPARPARRTWRRGARPARRCRSSGCRRRGSRAPLRPSRRVTAISAPGFRQVLAEIEFDPLAQAHQRRIGRGRDAVGAEAGGIDPGQRHRHGLAQAELGFEPVGRRRDVADARRAAIAPTVSSRRCRRAATCCSRTCRPHSIGACVM